MQNRWVLAATLAAGLSLSTAGALAIPAAQAANVMDETPVTAPAPAQPPGPLPSIGELEAQMLATINSERAAHGAGPVQSQPWAHQVAEEHSQQMAAQQNIFHNISGYIDAGHAAMGATYLGENVAMDSTLAADDALLASDPAHNDITLDPRFNYVGVGVALDAKNWVYLTEDFAEIGAGGSTLAVASAPVKPASAPPAAKPATATRPAAVAAPKPPPVAVTAAVPAAVPAVPAAPSGTAPATSATAAPPPLHAGVPPAATGAGSNTGSAIAATATPVSHTSTVPAAGLILGIIITTLSCGVGAGLLGRRVSAQPETAGWTPSQFLASLAHRMVSGGPRPPATSGWTPPMAYGRRGA